MSHPRTTKHHDKTGQNRSRHPSDRIETEWMITSRPADTLAADRRYWGIETGLHLRLDVSAGGRPKPCAPFRQRPESGDDPPRGGQCGRALDSTLSQSAPGDPARLLQLHGRPQLPQSLLPRNRLSRLLVATLRNQPCDGASGLTPDWTPELRECDHKKSNETNRPGPGGA